MQGTIEDVLEKSEAMKKAYGTYYGVLRCAPLFF
jgi:hypothetical protein